VTYPSSALSLPTLIYPTLYVEGDFLEVAQTFTNLHTLPLAVQTCELARRLQLATARLDNAIVAFSKAVLSFLMDAG